MKNKKNINLTNVIKIRDWMKENDKKGFPSNRAEDIEEKKLGHSLGYIRNRVVKPYMEKNEIEKKEYKDRHPEIEEIVQIMEEIEKKVISTEIIKINKIKDWIEKNNYTKYPNASSKNAEEKRLGDDLSRIRSRFIKPYNELKTKKEKEKYKKKHPDFDNVLKIMEEIDINIIKNVLIDVKEINRWKEDNNIKKALNAFAQNKEESNMARRLDKIRRKVNKIYNKWNLEQQKRCLEEYPEVNELLMLIEKVSGKEESISFKNALEIRKWSESNGRPPRITLYDDEERELGIKLHNIKNVMLKTYYNLKTDEERKKFRRRNPKLDEIIEIVEEIDIHPYVINARNIKEWSETMERLPSRSKDDEKEEELAIQLKSIRYYVVKPYIAMSDEEKAKYREEQSDMVEAIDIISELDVKYGKNKKKELAKLIQEDIKRDKKLKDARKLKEKYKEELKKHEQEKEAMIIWVI